MRVCIRCSRRYSQSKTQGTTTSWSLLITRRRQVNVTVIGTAEDVGDRKWNNGEVINTRRKFTDEEKAYDVHYDLQQKR